jgi:hypothetical protein
MSEQSKSRVEELAGRLANDSVGAIDYGTNAKALALQDANVREKLEALLDDGFRVKRLEAKSGTGAGALSFAVTFHLEKDNPGSAMDDSSTFTVVLELPTRTVKAIVEGDIASPGAPDAPFALAVGSRSGEPVPIDEPGRGGRPGLTPPDRDGVLDDLLSALRRRFPSVGVYNSWKDTLTVEKVSSNYETTVGTVGGDTRTGNDYGPDDENYDNKWDGSNDPGAAGDLLIRF